MVRYRRNFVVGGTYFFTVTLADRRSTALTDNIDALRRRFARHGEINPSRSKPLSCYRTIFMSS
jgi:putative transposase